MSRSRQLKALRKSTKLMYKEEFHSRDCSTMMHSVAIWSLKDLSRLNPIWCSRRLTSTAPLILFNKIQLNTFPGTDRSAMPLQFSELLRSPFLGSSMMRPSFQSVRSSSPNTVAKFCHLRFRQRYFFRFPYLKKDLCFNIKNISLILYTTYTGPLVLDYNLWLDSLQSYTMCYQRLRAG